MPTASGEQVQYKLFDSSNGSVQDLNEAMYFSPDLHQGSIDNPVPFSLPLSSGATHEIAAVQSFRDSTQSVPQRNDVPFRSGKIAGDSNDRDRYQRTPGSTMRTDAQEGLNNIVWHGQSDAGELLAAGVYFVRLQTANGTVVRKRWFYNKKYLIQQKSDVSLRST